MSLFPRIYLQVLFWGILLFCPSSKLVDRTKFNSPVFAPYNYYINTVPRFAAVRFAYGKSTVLYTRLFIQAVKQCHDSMA